jgi:hypothetical protein
MGGTKTVPLCLDCHGKVHDRKAFSASELTKLALARKKAKSERVGQVPFGYTLADDGVSLEPEITEQVGIAIMQQLKSEVHTLRSIARELEQQDIATKEGQPHGNQ